MVVTKIYDDGKLVDEIEADFMAGIFYTNSKDGTASVKVQQCGKLRLIDCFAVSSSVADMLFDLTDRFSEHNKKPASMFLIPFIQRLDEITESRKKTGEEGKQ